MMASSLVVTRSNLQNLPPTFDFGCGQLLLEFRVFASGSLQDVPHLDARMVARGDERGVQGDAANVATGDV